MKTNDEMLMNQPTSPVDIMNSPLLQTYNSIKSQVHSEFALTVWGLPTIHPNQPFTTGCHFQILFAENVRWTNLRSKASPVCSSSSTFFVPPRRGWTLWRALTKLPRISWVWSPGLSEQRSRFVERSEFFTQWKSHISMQELVLWQQNSWATLPPKSRI